MWATNCRRNIILLVKCSTPHSNIAASCHINCIHSNAIHKRFVRVVMCCVMGLSVCQLLKSSTSQRRWAINRGWFLRLSCHPHNSKIPTIFSTLLYRITFAGLCVVHQWDIRTFLLALCVWVVYFYLVFVYNFVSPNCVCYWYMYTIVHTDGQTHTHRYKDNTETYDIYRTCNCCVCILRVFSKTGGLLWCDAGQVGTHTELERQRETRNTHTRLYTLHTHIRTHTSVVFLSK